MLLTAKISARKKKTTQRNLSAYNIFMKTVLGSLKQSHSNIAHGHRFKAAAQSWTNRLNLTSVKLSKELSISIDSLPKSLLQNKALDDAKDDLDNILHDLRINVEQSAFLEASAGDDFNKDVPRANSDYNRHMQRTLAKLKDERGDLPYQQRFKLAAFEWQQMKKVNENKSKKSINNNIDSENDKNDSTYYSNSNSNFEDCFNDDTFASASTSYLPNFIESSQQLQQHTPEHLFQSTSTSKHFQRIPSYPQSLTFNDSHLNDLYTNTTPTNINGNINNNINNNDDNFNTILTFNDNDNDISYFDDIKFYQNIL